MTAKTLATRMELKTVKNPRITTALYVKEEKESEGGREAGERWGGGREGEGGRKRKREREREREREKQNANTAHFLVYVYIQKLIGYYQGRIELP